MRFDTQHTDENDAGQPMEIPEPMLAVNLTTLHRLHSMRSRDYSFILLFIVLAFTTPSTIWGVPNIFIIAPAALACDYLIRRRFFLPQMATDSQRHRNRELYKAIYERTQSNYWTQGALATSGFDALNLYENSLEATISSIKKDLKERHKVGVSDCSGGHEPYCVHRLPPKVKEWIEQP